MQSDKKKEPESCNSLTPENVHNTRFNSCIKHSSQYGHLPSISFYPRGVKLDPQNWSGRSNLKPDDKRGKIIQWSTSSRRRLREFVLTHEVIGATIHNVTLTVPGGPMSLESSAHLWKLWRDVISLRGWSCVWRKELQERGAFHWHMVLYTSKESGRDLWIDLPTLWRSCLRTVSLSEYPQGFDWITKNGYGQIGIHRDQVLGADSHSCLCVKGSDDNVGWYRYLIDHASKVKQCQLLKEGSGRHWGVINRKGFSLSAVDSVNLPLPVYNRFLRVYQRLCTAQCKTSRKGVPFGRRLNRRRRFGVSGSTVLFSRPQTVHRIMEWAREVQEPVTAPESHKPPQDVVPSKASD